MVEPPAALIDHGQVAGARRESMVPRPPRAGLLHRAPVGGTELVDAPRFAPLADWVTSLSLPVHPDHADDRAVTGLIDEGVVRVRRSCSNANNCERAALGDARDVPWPS